MVNKNRLPGSKPKKARPYLNDFAPPTSRDPVIIISIDNHDILLPSIRRPTSFQSRASKSEPSTKRGEQKIVHRNERARILHRRERRQRRTGRVRQCAGQLRLRRERWWSRGVCRQLDRWPSRNRKDKSNPFSTPTSPALNHGPNPLHQNRLSIRRS